MSMKFLEVVTPPPSIYHVAPPSPVVGAGRVDVSVTRGGGFLGGNLTVVSLFVLYPLRPLEGRRNRNGLI